MLYIEQKFIGLLSPRLRNFKRKPNNVYNFSCPLCNDSEKKINKARGYLLPKNDHYQYYCHNCGRKPRFKTFLKGFDIGLYMEMTKEMLVASGQSTESNNTPVIQSHNDAFDNAIKELIPILDLPKNHPAIQYLLSRHIPKNSLQNLYFIDKFNHWTNSIIPDKFHDPRKFECGRIVIPFKTREGKMFGYQGRSLVPDDQIRYITIIIDEGHPRVFGFDRLDVNKRFYVFEGPFDSMFIPNSLGCGGSDLVTTFYHLNLDKNQGVLCFDNDRRNPEIVKKMKEAVDEGFKVCIWPDHIQVNDVNKMILEGMTSSEINAIIDLNTFKGLEAKLRLTSWRKI